MTLMDNLMNDQGESSDRRMLVFILVDESGSMSGAPIQAVAEGLDFLNRQLRKTPEAVELVHICVIGFSSAANVKVRLTPITSFSPPSLSASGGTDMAGALRLCNQEIDRHFRPNRGGEIRGDYKPMIFLLTDGEPNDLNSAIEAGQAIINRPSGKTVGTFLALGCGPHVNPHNLARIAKNVAIMENMSAENLQAFFQWVTASVATASKRASRAAAGEQTMAVDTPDVPLNSSGEKPFKLEF